tara:strand:+ start:126 stop:896 length:771 start_codon:yes stop_codon:yes gene_type:complete
MPKEKVKFVKYGKQGKKDQKAGDWVSLADSKTKDMNKKKAERKQKKGKGYIAKKYGDSPANMKKQGYNARLDDSLGAKHGKKSQSMKDRRDESEGMEKAKGKRKFSGNKSSAQGSPAMKKEKVTFVKKGKPSKDMPGFNEMGKSKKMNKKKAERKEAKGKGTIAQKYGDSPAKMSGRSYDMKEAYNKDLSDKARLHYLENERHDADSPAKMYGKKKGSPAHMSRDLSYGGPVIDQEPKALSHMGASKVLKHMKSKM